MTVNSQAPSFAERLPENTVRAAVARIVAPNAARVPLKTEAIATNEATTPVIRVAANGNRIGNIDTSVGCARLPR